MPSASAPPSTPLTGWFPLENRRHLLLTGNDRARYLNGQITNDVQDLPPHEARYAVITNHKGQLEGDLFIYQAPPWSAGETGDALAVETSTDQLEPLSARIDRYIIADDVELREVENPWIGFHILFGDDDHSRDLQAHASHLKPTFPEAHHVVTARLGQKGIDLWFPESSDSAVEIERRLSEHLARAGADRLLPDAIERSRIAQALPAWGAELTPGLLPPEARVEARAISYDKGCYIGQEVISRIRSVGKVNRLLVRLTCEGTTPPRAGDVLFAERTEKKSPIGRITSVTPQLATDASHLEVLALGYVKSQHAAPGTRLRVAATETDAATTSEAGRSVTVLPHPTDD